MYKSVCYSMMYGLLTGIIWDEINYIMYPYIIYYNRNKIFNKGFYLGVLFGLYRSIKN